MTVTIIKKRLRDCLSIIGMGLAMVACSNDLSYDYEEESSYNNEPFDVTFTVTADQLGVSTRAAGGPGAHQTLARGANIDMLVYAVYMVESGDNGITYKLLNQYGKGYIDTDDNDATEYFKDKAAYVDAEERPGQTIVNVKNVFDYSSEKEDYGSYQMTLRLMKNQQYAIAFWAQSSETAAYDTKDLRLMSVDYTAGDSKLAPNNDELRDAFCKSETFSVSVTAPARTVVLTRPFAQINVATTGADYRNVVEGQGVFKNMGYKYSKITINGVANSMDIVADKIFDDQLLEVTYDWAKMPAFYKYAGDTFPEDLVGKKKDAPEDDEDPYEMNPDEEYLWVNLDNDKNFKPYKTIWPTAIFETVTFTKDEEDDEAESVEIRKLKSYETEVFKYLSMCYILVPSSTTSYFENASTLLTSVKIEFAEQYSPESGASNTNNYESYQTIQNVPAKRNWRTNLLGGFGEKAESSNSIFYSADLYVSQNALFDNYDDNTVIYE